MQYTRVGDEVRAATVHHLADHLYVETMI